MSKFQWLSAIIILILSWAIFNNITNKNEIIIENDGYYGSGEKVADDTKIYDFKINVSKSVLDDLKYRLENARISHEVLEDVDTFEYGFNSKTLHKLKNYWINQYNWKKYENILNSFPQFTTEIEGLNIHFIRVIPDKKYTKVYPLLLVHGWPGNIFEFYKIIPMLSDPKNHLPSTKDDFAFELIIPSIPGYGYSSQPRKKDLNQIATARIFKKLMERLGHKKFFLQGGDWGAVITSNLARFWPENCLGLHLNMAFFSPTSIWDYYYQIVGSIFPTLVFKDKEFSDYNALSIISIILKEFGYGHIQGTKPDTVGTSLNDSPIGLAAYILEKYSTWTSNKYIYLQDGGLTKDFTLDELITIVMIYWTNGNIVSSQRYYREYFYNSKCFETSKVYVSIPTGYASFPNDLGIRTPLEIFSLHYNTTHFTLMEDGGHFAAFQKPKELAYDIFKFVKTV
ncbi:Epoxide hydrolase 1 [Strongyloides ratti]|uniref:Epoxide hydrolase n=1 Tax=Strongyloides ratti TaxID=34506 RepID=A0A090MVK2_STRRB|nr:Epoxide hydrolase 1 [Strongyloides ratti]CEF62958.1 Epoxide hydrolase 1 [Strongyloides ratti]